MKTIKKMYSVRFRGVGNPDHQQYSDIAPACDYEAESIKEIMDAAERYQRQWNVGGGNWPNTIVLHGGRFFANLSFNLRLWSRTHQEIFP